MRTSVIAATLIALALLATFAFLRFNAFMRDAQAQDGMMTKSFVADPNNKTVLVVRGWNRDELGKILEYFRNAYELSTASEWAITTKAENTFAITFPKDIQPKLLFFLVNYLNYPKDFDLTHRVIVVVSHVILSPAFGIPDQSLTGQQAEIYCPANDTDYDLVYVHIENGMTYRVSFTNLAWKQMPTARIPNGIVGL